jgi:hypothetical protein
VEGGGRRLASVCHVCALCIYDEYVTPKPVFVNPFKEPGIDNQPGGIDSLESNPGLLKRLQIRAQFYKSLIFGLALLQFHILETSPTC